MGVGDRVGNGEFSAAVAAELCPESLQQHWIGRLELFRRGLYLVDRGWSVGALFKRRCAVVGDQSALCGRESVSVIIQRRDLYGSDDGANHSLGCDFRPGSDDGVGDGGRIDYGGGGGGPRGSSPPSQQPAKTPARPKGEARGPQRNR